MPVRTFSLFEGGQGGTLMALLGKVAESFTEEANGLANAIADTVGQAWKSAARKRARHPGWGEKYAAAIRFEPAGKSGDRARIYVDETAFDKHTGNESMMFVNIVEDGIKSWSIRDALLNSKRVKYSKTGMKYIHVPFRWRTPPKPGVKASKEIFTGTMPGEVYKIVKKGVRLKGEQYGHMQGMQRFNRAGHANYFTFRTVSEKTPKDKWQYPNIGATPVYPAIERRVGLIIESMIGDYLDGKVKAVEKEYS